MISELVPSGIVRNDEGYAVDPVLPTRFIDKPPQGPVLIGGHTPGCRNAYGEAYDDNEVLIAANKVGCKPSECECQGKEAVN